MSAASIHRAPGEHRDDLDPYLPGVLLRHLAEAPDDAVRTLDATVLFTDISGFTKLSERLVRRGREGAEELVEAIDGAFGALLTVAHAHGASLIKFAGDALLLLFDGDGHEARACASAIGMRRMLREVGRLETSAGRVTLRMSQGLHSGELHLFLVGSSHRELLLAGSGASAVTLMEKAADAGEIVVSHELAARLPRRCAGAVKGPGRLLLGGPPVSLVAPAPAPPVAPELVAACLSTEVRAHVRSGRQPAEHRHVTTAFVRYQGTDALIEREGPQAAAAALHDLVSDVQRAVDEHQVCFLESDVDADGGKLMLTAGAPRMVGDDEERMLLAVRKIIEGERRLPVSIGVNRGTVFCADLGPPSRRSYSVMGDTVNLAARVTAKAPAGEVYATASVLERSATRFAVTEVPPFMVKGKQRPVQAWSLGPAIGSRAREGVAVHVPFVGRRPELDRIDAALEDVRAGSGRSVEIAGEAGIGKTRLLEELRERAGGLTRLRATCEAYTSATPYVAWRELLRPLIGAAWEDADEAVVRRLAATVAAGDPGLLDWLPLLAIPFGATAPATPQVADLAAEFRRVKLHEVVLRFLRARLPEPALVEIEDAHLMDAASSELLAALASEVAGRPWLVVTTRRDGPGGYRAPQGAALVRVDLAPFSAEETLELAEAVTDAAPLPPHTVRLAAERSGGNPQFLQDLLRAVATGSDALPDSIETAAMARIDLLEPADRMLVRRAAVLGLSFHPRQLTDVLEEPDAEPDAATWNRLSSYFAEDGDGLLRFRRAVVRDAAYNGLPFGLRRRLHARVGARLEREAAAETAGTLALHFSRAGDQVRTWRYARIAGDHARDRLAPQEAAESYRLAIRAARTLDVPAHERATVWEALGETLAQTGELADAGEALRAARRLVGDDPVREAALLLRHAQVAERAGRVPSAVRWALRALRALEGRDGPEAARCRARTLSVLATVRQREGRMAQAIALCGQAIVEADEAGEDGALAHACFILDWALFDSGRPREAIHSPRALAIYERLGELDRQAAVLNNMGGFAYHEGRWSDAVALYRRAAEASQRAGDVANAAFGDCNVGEVLSDQGHLDDAEASLRRALRVWRGSGYEWGAAFALAMLGRTAVRAGRAPEGIELLREALAEFQRLRAMSDAALTEAYLAEALAFAGEGAQALAAAERLLPDAGRTAPLLQRVRGMALAQLGAPEAAGEALRASLRLALEQGNDYELAVSAHALEALEGAGALDEEQRRRRDDVTARLHVVAMPLALSPASPDRRARRAAAPR